MVFGVVLGIVLGAGASSWAGMELLRPQADVLASPGFTTVTGEQGSVGHSIRLNTSVEWRARSVVNGRANGTVTSVEHTDGGRAQPGDVLLHVDLRPVVVAEGATPMFRDLGEGDVGGDVTQVQEFLIDGGFYSGEASGRFTSGTAWAVREWQRSLGIQRDGVVRAGDVVTVPSLPARLALSDGVRVGDDLRAGAEVVQVLRKQPGFEIALAEGQARLIEPGQRVTLTRGENDWSAVVDEVLPASDTEPARAVLSAPEGGSICGKDCTDIPLGATTLVPSRIEIVEETSGVVLPAAAVVTGADGSTAVRLPDGELRPVEVVVGTQGSVVVDGLDVGTSVRVPGDAE